MLGRHMTRTCADMSVTGCWASSGYSVQGCALLEQKLRQCMDAPVRSLLSMGLRCTANPRPSETPTRRKTTSTSTFPGCTPRLWVLTSGIKAICFYSLCTLCIPTAVNYANHHGGVQVAYESLEGVMETIVVYRKSTIKTCDWRYIEPSDSSP